MDTQPSRPTGAEPWLLRLKAAVAAGYYRTEADEGQQTRFPWQDRTCGDCPFWTRDRCLVREARRGAGDATCRYFDAWNYAEAESIIQYNKIPAPPFGGGGPGILPSWPYDDDQAA